MSGNRIGGLKAKEKNIAKHGENFYKEIVAKGGRKTDVLKGFAHPSADPVAAGKKGGAISRRGKKVSEDVQA